MTSTSFIRRQWTRMARRPWLVALLTFVGLCLLTAGIVTSVLRAQQARELATEWRLHTLNVQLEAQRLFVLLADAELAQRRYLQTGAAASREQFETFGPRLTAGVDRLLALTQDNRRQQLRLATIRQLMLEEWQGLQHTIDEASPSPLPGARSAISPARTALDEQMEGLFAEESRLLVERQAVADRAGVSAQERLWVLIVLGAVLILVCMAATTAALGAQRRADEADMRTAVERGVNEQLQSKVTAATSSLLRAEERLRQTNKLQAIGQLTGGIAHDFNNMLAVILGALELARLRISNTEEVRKYIASAADATRSASKLTQRLLAFARIQPLDPGIINANGLIAQMSELLRRTLGETIQLETVAAGGLWNCHADPNELESAILNLAVNARDAMADGGRLTVETGNAYLDENYAAAHPEVVAGQYVSIAVSDNGVGMSPDVAARAFEPFFTTKGVGQGTGLGLSQVFGFIKQSGGHVAIYSELGKGTTVRMYLPRHLGGAPAVAVSRLQNTEAARAQEGEVVLVVEDNPQVRQISVDSLRALGYVVHEAADPMQALDAAARLPELKLLFTDIVMPGMTGRQLADELSRRMPSIKVLYTTGYTRNAVVHDGKLDPGVAFIAKPFTMELLASKVREVLDQRQ